MTNGQALAALNLLVAAAQTGFGPFLNLALAGQGWGQAQIGVALSTGTIAALAFQMPGGALVDAIYRKRLILAVALVLTGLTAALVGADAQPVPVLGAEIVHAAAATVITPAIAAVTLGLCSHREFGERLGSNTKWASLGSAAAAMLIGPVASYRGSRWVFPFTAIICLAAVLAVFRIRPAESDNNVEPHPALMHPKERRQQGHQFWTMYVDSPLHWFALCTFLFHAANAAMLPLSLNALAARNAGEAELTITAAILGSQIVVVMFSAQLGRNAERHGRRRLLLLGFAALPTRGLVLAMLPGPIPLVCVQILDGVSASVMGIMIPLIAADLTRRTGSLNLAIGSLGFAAGIGATASTLFGGWLAQRAGTEVALLALSLIGVCGFTLVGLVMPETRPPAPLP